MGSDFHVPGCSCDRCTGRYDLAHALRCPCAKCASKNQGASLAAKLAHVQDLLNPPDGMDPLISRDDALRLLDMPDVAAVKPTLTKRNGTAAPRRRFRMLLVDRLGFERIEECSGGRHHIVAAHGGFGGRYLQVTFEEYGHTVRNGEDLIEYREVSEYAAPPMFREPVKVLPNEGVVARAIFDTDPDVCSFIASIADNVVRFTETRWNTALGRSETVAVAGVNVAEIRQWDRRLLDTAWDRNENGWADRALLRARAIIGTIEKAPK